MSTLYLIWWLSIDSYSISPHTSCGPHTLAVVKVLIIYHLQTSSNPFDVCQIHHTSILILSKRRGGGHNGAISVTQAYARDVSPESQDYY